MQLSGFRPAPWGGGCKDVTRLKSAFHLWFAILSSTIVLYAAVPDVQAAGENEVEVKGCVVDAGGKPYKGVYVYLHGLNYPGGAGYTGNDSVDRTDWAGEFTVRMKAGIPGEPARAKLNARLILLSGKTFPLDASTDGWREPVVENEGRPIDLRQKCFRFAFPIDIAGVVEIRGNELPYFTKELSLRIRVNGEAFDYLRAWYLPLEGTGELQTLDMALQWGDHYSVDIPKQPFKWLSSPGNPDKKRCLKCEILRGKNGKVDNYSDKLILLPATENAWALTALHVYCEKGKIIERHEECDDNASQGNVVEEKPPAQPAEGGGIALRRNRSNAGAENFERAIAQAEQEERDRPAREAQRLAAEAKAKADAERLQQERLAAERRLKDEQERQARAPQEQNSGSGLGEALGILAGVLEVYADSRAQRRAEVQARAQQEQQRRQQEQQLRYGEETVTELFNRQAAQNRPGPAPSGQSSRPQANPNRAGSATPAVATGPTQVSDANSCIDLIAGRSSVIKNNCGYPIFYTFCAEHPKPSSALSAFDCDKRQFGSAGVSPHDVQGIFSPEGARGGIHVVACRYKNGYDGPGGVVWDAQRRVIKFYCTYQRSPS